MVIGAMLYWGEGYKGDDKNPAKLVDFANSDPDMIKIFLKFLRTVFKIDEKKIKCIYCSFEGNIGNLSRYHNEKCKSIKGAT